MTEQIKSAIERCEMNLSELVNEKLTEAGIEITIFEHPMYEPKVVINTTKHDEEIRADERNKCMNETQVFIDKHSLEIGMKKCAELSVRSLKAWEEVLQEIQSRADYYKDKNHTLFVETIACINIINQKLAEIGKIGE